MAEAVVSYVVERVGDLFTQKATSLYGVRGQVERARTQLLFMQTFLKDADAKQKDDARVRIWVAEIRDAAYDLEDVIATYVVKVESERKGGMKNVQKRYGRIFKEGLHLHKIGSEIGNITTKLSNLRSSLQTDGIRMEIRETGGPSTSLHLSERQQLLRRTFSHVIEHDVVGLEDSAKEVIMHLVKDENCPRVVSIWGMGGLGKTTLAKQVYHHKEVRRYFDCFAWVCIAQQYQLRDVWKTILVKLISATKREEIAKLENDEIAKRIYHFQIGRRCLVVLDDIWSGTF